MINGKKAKVTLIVLAVFVVTVSVFLVPHLGEWLVIEDELQESDIIMVPMGSLFDRIPHAVDVYHGGFSDRILFVNSYKKGNDFFLERGLEIPPGNAQTSKRAAINLGVPEENIFILAGDARSTQDEALILREYIRNNKNIESIILVTSKYHSGRSKKIFTKAFSYLDREISIYASPSKYDPFNAKQWWRDREDLNLVLLEYLKLANFYFRTQFLLN